MLQLGGKMGQFTGNRLIIDETTLPIICDFAEGLPGGFLIYQAEGDEEILFFNKRLVELFGCDDEEDFKDFTCNSFRSIVHLDDSERVHAEIISQINASKNAFNHIIFKSVRKNGEAFYINEYGHFVHTDRYGDVYYAFMEEVSSEYSHSISRQKVRFVGLDLKKARESKKEMAVINELTRDFEYVDYVELGDSMDSDITTHYRESKAMLRNIPEWKATNTFHDRLVALADNFIVKQEREFFLERTRRDVILSHLERTPAYFVDFRGKLDGFEKFYQIKFTIDKDEDGVFRGIVVGLHCVDDQMSRELEVRREIEKIIRIQTEKLREKNLALTQMTEDMVDFLGVVTESRDISSGQHVKRVKRFSSILAQKVVKELPEYGLSERDADLIAFLSPLHDVGKISISDSILLKPGRLTAEEFEEIKAHSHKGSEIIERISNKWSDEFRKMALDIAKCHHEKWDGRGYPLGLKGDEIPIAAQIVSVADCYDALTSERPYKSPIDPEEAFDMILNGECGAFSDKLMRVFKMCRTSFVNNAINPVLENVVPEDIENSISDKSIKVFDGVSVLLVEDDELMRELSCELLEDEGAKVVEACDGIEAIEAYNSHGRFDMILMDITMPRMDGITAISRIRELENDREKPMLIVALTADSTNSLVIECVSAGANDFVSKPMSIAKLSQVFITFMLESANAMEKRLEKSIINANTDALTSVKNITAYTERVAEISGRIGNDDSLEFAIVLCDVNKLKYENDVYGHDVGDLYIKNCCKIICDVFTHSPVYRIGGDEFVVILEGEDYENSGSLMSELKAKVLRASQIETAVLGKASFSAGIAVYDPDEDFEMSDVVRRADASMYNDKRIMEGIN